MFLSAIPSFNLYSLVNYLGVNTEIPVLYSPHIELTPATKTGKPETQDSSVLLFCLSSHIKLVVFRPLFFHGDEIISINIGNDYCERLLPSRWHSPLCLQQCRHFLLRRRAVSYLPFHLPQVTFLPEALCVAAAWQPFFCFWFFF